MRDAVADCLRSDGSAEAQEWIRPGARGNAGSGQATWSQSPSRATTARHACALIQSSLRRPRSVDLLHGVPTNFAGPLFRDPLSNRPRMTAHDLGVCRKTRGRPREDWCTGFSTRSLDVNRALACFIFARFLRRCRPRCLVDSPIESKAREQHTKIGRHRQHRRRVAG